MENEPFLKAVKQDLILKLTQLKTDYKNGVPNKIIRSTSPDNNWKVRVGGWFQTVALRFENILDRQDNGENLLSEEMFDELFAYWTKLTADQGGFKQRDITQDDIDRTEAMIDKVIAELGK